MKHTGNILLGLLLVTRTGSLCQARCLTDKEAKSAPRARVACLPTPTLGVRYYGPDDLGEHMYSFRFGVAERDGIVYTCRGGHVDVTHVRKAADWTAYLAYHCREALLENRTQLAFKMREPSRYYVRFQYPPGWRDLPSETRQQTAREVSVGLGQYLGYVGSVWHEVLTWHGYKGSGIYPEFHSAFSWEDNYSNAIGAYIGALALRDPDRAFAEAAAYYIDRELRALEVQPKEAARQAAERVRGTWYTGGYFSCDMVRRHLDIGLDDGMVTPWLIPGVAECNDTTAKPYSVPTLAFLEAYGFHVTVEIELREWEKDEILRAVYPDPNDRQTHIEPARHLPAIIKQVRATALKKYGPHADEAGLLSTPSRVSQSACSEKEPSTSGPGSDSQGPGTHEPTTSAISWPSDSDS